mgnify:CR=1 FL=1
MGWFGDALSSIGKDWFGAEGSQAGAGMGAIMNLGGMLGMADPNQYSRKYLNNLNSQLAPLKQSMTKMGDLAKQYEDPDSQFNQGMRDQVRGQNIDYAYDMNARNRAAALGTGYEGLGKQQDDAMLTQAIGSGLKNLTQQRGQQMQQASNLYQQQGTMANAYSQAKLQNRLLAGQQAQLPYQYMMSQGIGLLQKSLYDPK